MKKPDRLPVGRVVAAFLILTLILPNPVFALRQMERAEDRSGLEGLDQALQDPKVTLNNIPAPAPASAGLEEADDADDAKKGIYRDRFDFYAEDLRQWLSTQGKIEWEAGPRYLTARGEIRVLPPHGIEVYPDEDWASQFPELKKLEKNEPLRGSDHANKEAFGSIEIDIFRSRSRSYDWSYLGQIGPGEGYRLLSSSQRHHLDAWRKQALRKIVEWASSRNLPIYGSPPEFMVQRNGHRLSGYENRKNYIEPYDDAGLW